MSRRAFSILVISGAAIATASCGSGDKHLALGESCTLNSECKDPLVCKFGSCHQACIQSRDCPTSERCVQIDGVGVCQQQTESQCTYGGTGKCKTPLVCAADNICRNTCTTADNCLKNQDCVASVCLELAEAAAWRTDGGVAVGLDGGADAGGTGNKDATILDASSTSADVLDDVAVWTADGSGSSQTDTTTATRGLVAYYPFNGNAQDESGNGNHGSVSGATLTTDRFGQEAKAYHFGPGRTYISVPDSDSLDLFSAGTLAFWVMLDSTAKDWHAFISKMVGTANVDMNYSAYLTSVDQLAVTVGDHVQFLVITSTGPLVTRHWYHVAYSFDGKDIVLYLDGKLQATKQQTLKPAANSATLEIGGWTANSNDYFLIGSLDDIRIYNRALSETEVDALYQENGWVGRGD